MAAGVRGGATAGIIFHGDRGKPTPRRGLQPADLGMVQSVGRTGVCWDNSVAESLWSSLKRDLVHRYRFPDRATDRVEPPVL
jgi:transposase InsO family protein